MLANLNLLLLNGEWVIISNNNIFQRLWGKVKNFFRTSKGGVFYGIRWKLVLAYSALSLAPLLVLSIFVTSNLEERYSETAVSKYLKDASVLAVTISDGKFSSNQDKETMKKFDEEVAKNAGLARILVFDNKGMVVNDSLKKIIGKTVFVREVLEAYSENDTANIYRKGENKERIIYSSSKIVDDSSSEVVGAVLIVASVEDSFLFTNVLRNLVSYLTIAMVVVVSILVFLTSKMFLDPVKKFLIVVDDISDGNFNSRVNITGKNEFADLAESFNHMADKIAHGEKIRDEFVSNVGHELKTPLSSIKVLTEVILLQENVPIETYDEFLKDINSEIDRMTLIVNDLLKLVKIDQAEAGLNIEKVDLNKMIIDIMKRLYVLAEKKNIELVYECESEAIAEVDDMKFTSAITNLIENGIKYTDNKGTVKITLDADHQNAFIAVHDTGVGISEEEQPEIFTRFYRVDKTRDRETGGTGLGLAITRATILLHKGAIKVSSKEEEGSVFSVRVPLKYVDDTQS